MSEPETPIQTPSPPGPDRMDNPRRFFVVWSPQGGPPIARIASFNEARIAALRLSGRFPQQDFFVLASRWGRIGTPAVAVEEVTPKPEAIP